MSRKVRRVPVVLDAGEIKGFANGRYPGDSKRCR